MEITKAQVNIEFIISISIFLLTISYLSFLIVINIPFYHQRAVNDMLMIKGYQLSELLLFDKGYPDNWDSTNVKRIGLSTGEPYHIDGNKVDKLNNMCKNNYSYVNHLLGQNIIIINITRDGTQILDCGSKYENIKPIFWVERFALLDDKAVRIKIAVGG